MPPIPEALVEERGADGASTPSESPVTAGIPLMGELDEEVAAQTVTPFLIPEDQIESMMRTEAAATSGSLLAQA
eukprot:11660401-Prorocentrum_lima.AAC.1